MRQDANGATLDTAQAEQTNSVIRESDEQVTSPTPRVLILTSGTKKLASLSPFQRKEGCDRFGKVSRCEKLRDGGLEVEFTHERDAKRALSATEFTYTVRDGNVRRLVRLPISVSAHRTKNSSRGIIYCADLEGVSDDEIADGLSDFGVISARRIKSRKAGVMLPTHNIILTFNQLDIPREIFIGYERVKVRLYIPSPMRCYRCLRFGHTRDYCRNRPTCGICAAADHTGDSCTADTWKCINCDERQTPHTAFDPKCPALLREKEILAIKFTERLSFREARERYNSTHPKRSYASVAKEPRIDRAEIGQQREGNISQLISLLQSFGLSLSGPGVPSGPAASHTPQPATVVHADAGTQTSLSDAGEVSGSDPGGGWTLVRGRHGTGKTQAAMQCPGGVTPPTTAPRPAGMAVMEALRRGEEERRVREAKRARLVEKAREVLSSPGVDAALASSATQSPTLSEPPPTESSPPMGPPPPPPPLRRPPPLPPPATVAEATRPQSVPAHSAHKHTEERPTKRSLPWESSPTDSGSPRARQRCQPGSTPSRSSSADGRLRRGHARIQFGDKAPSGAAQYF